MDDDATRRVTGLLRAMGSGDPSARERLFEILYDELRGVARAQIARGPARATIEPTALVNEACLRLLGHGLVDLENRRHFFFVAARAMRDVLGEEARRREALKRGGGWRRADLEGVAPNLMTSSEDLLALDEALGKLEAEDPVAADIVRLRFFAGASEDDVADVLALSKRTVSRRWARARARLALLLEPPRSR